MRLFQYLLQQWQHASTANHFFFRRKKHLGSALIFICSFSFFYLIVFLSLGLFHASESDSKQTCQMHYTTLQSTQSPTYEKAMSTCASQEQIAKKILRLHVIANSDSTVDQLLKLRVRDSILKLLQSSVNHASNLSDAEAQVRTQFPEILQEAEKTIVSDGYDYPVSVTLETRYFPAKQYGDLTFPPGQYRALCVEIGQAKGRNWWCVLFPSLCFVNDTTAIVPDSSKKKLQKDLGDAAYDSLLIPTSSPAAPTATPTPKISFHSALYDWWKQQ